MNLAERIYLLHRLFRESRYPVAFRTIQDKLLASPATVKRVIGYMRDHMDAPIVYERQHNGYRYADGADEFELPGLWFNQSELYALLAAEQLLESVNPGLLSPSLGPLKARIRKLLAQSGHSSDVISGRILIQPVASRAVDNRIFGEVADAVLNGRVAELTYTGRDSGETIRRRVHPYRLVHYRDNWYLAAHCEHRRDLRTFALDCIGEWSAGDTPVSPPDPRALDRLLGASFGIFSGEARAWAVLRFTARRARWVADERWHPDQIGQWTSDGYELQVPYSDPRELVMDILKYGPDVEVLAPDELREAVAARVRETAAVYGAT